MERVFNRVAGSILQLSLLLAAVGMVAALNGAPLGPEIAAWSALVFIATAILRGIVALFALLE